MLQVRKHQTRTGAVAVEMALVCVIFFLLLFGILEYCRFLFILHVASNTARDTVRYASVKTSGGNMPGDPASISQAQIEGAAQTGQIDGNNVSSGMGGYQKNLTNYKVEVFTVDAYGLFSPIPDCRPLAGSSWNTAGFSQKIAVRVSGTYVPALPSFLMMGPGFPVSVTAMASSEGN